MPNLAAYGSYLVANSFEKLTLSYIFTHVIGWLMIN